ncbi:hypothetical protein HMPREF0290_0984 [Corynebacterium efficiens YS-314]|uniref:Uncharacterized protein n=1 Tax=Corynebacterium efficiens (strain DSM 44549 / YS-314 / AJ 12310 / JCM 11189 / NBRC 100395) TaxID=196164 RepID=Q8FRL8_COREF|nr:hypothetical protein HMPREF0290_0984 [Corynebacterium efficiens YS-314]BAC17553.1 hypothetical protein [Corynebacterium efficiens YS-314]
MFFLQLRHERFVTGKSNRPAGPTGNRATRGTPDPVGGGGRRQAWFYAQVALTR